MAADPVDPEVLMAAANVREPDPGDALRGAMSRTMWNEISISTPIMCIALPSKRAGDFTRAPASNGAGFGSAVGVRAPTFQPATGPGNSALLPDRADFKPANSSAGSVSVTDTTPELAAPPMFETRKMKNTTVCTVRVRTLLVRSSGRMNSIEAPVVPTIEAARAPHARNAVFTSGVASRSPSRTTPPEMTNRLPSSAMKEM